MRPDDVWGWVRKASGSSWVMSLRTVALDTPRSRDVVTVWDATGCAETTYSSTTALRTVARRSVASIVRSRFRFPDPPTPDETGARGSSRVYRVLTGAR